MTLLDRLKACVADEGEIPTLVQYAAKGGARVIKSGVVEYLCADSAQTVFATLQMKNARVTKLTPGPALVAKQRQDELVDEIRRDAGLTHGSLVSSRVLYSGLPLKGAFKWNDRVRISPCPRSARVGKNLDWMPKPQMSGGAEAHLGPPYPFVLEVKSFRSPNLMLANDRALRDLDTFQYVLTLLLHGRIRYAHHQADREWVGVRRRGKIEYHLLHSMFNTGLNGGTDDFARRRMKASPVHTSADYYNHLWGHDEELCVPDSLQSDLANFETLAFEAARCFKRACYWYALGVQMAAEPSLSTVAFATAVECILPRRSGTPCATCNRPTGSGPTKLFNEHVTRYGIVPASLERYRNAIYAARSALVHGAHAHRADQDFFSPFKRPLDGLLVEIVAQRSLIGWLRDSQRKI